MAAKAIVLDRNWYKQEREPAKAKDHLVTVDPSILEMLKGAPKIMTVKQIGALLTFSKFTVYGWCAEWDHSRGERGLKHQTIGGRIRVLKDDLAAFLMKQNIAG